MSVSSHTDIQARETPGPLSDLLAKSPVRNSVLPTGDDTFNGAKTHCPSGHRYDEANTYVAPTGRRQCRACRDGRQRARVERERRAAAAIDLTWEGLARMAAARRAVGDDLDEMDEEALRRHPHPSSLFDQIPAAHTENVVHTGGLV